MYAYQFLIEDTHPGELSSWQPVHPAPDRGLEIPTLAALKKQVGHDLGFVPDWLDALDPVNPQDTREYLQVEDVQEAYGRFFLLDIEGSEPHVLPPLAWSIAFALNHRKVAGT